MVRIDVKEAIPDKQSAYNIKRFRMGGLSIERPMRAIDAKNLTKAMMNETRGSFEQVLLETSKTVDADTARKALATQDKTRLKEMFGWSEWHSAHPNVLTLTFKFNPHDVLKSHENLAGYLDTYYQFSDSAVMVPNVNLERGIYEGSRQVRTERIIGPDDFKEYVGRAYELLEYKNKKPIFVPLPLKMDMLGVVDLADYYAKRRYLDVWVDFQGATSTDRTRQALLRGFTRRIEELGFGRELVLYCTNVRREITANMKDDLSPASDVLTSVLGANIVGVNREPQVPQARPSGGPPPIPRSILRGHKARLLNPATYYYVKVERADVTEAERDRLMGKSYNILRNCMTIDGELRTQTDHFLSDLTVRPYISGKEMVSRYKDGSLLKGLFPTSAEQAPIKDWF